MRFEEKILYRTRQHWIVSLQKLAILIPSFALPTFLIVYFAMNSHLPWAIGISLVVVGLVIAYEHYLWHHSYLLIGNQKVTLSVRNGIFSQYAMSIRYRNIKDAAVSKNSMLWFLLKYGTLFLRSSGADGDFIAHHVPKVGKVYALINALSRYTDDERAKIESIESLYAHHQGAEFWHQNHDLGNNLDRVRSLPGVLAVVMLTPEAREFLRSHEEVRNHGVHEALRRKHVLCFLHDDLFRPAAEILSKTTATWEVFFPGVPFPEVVGHAVISASPGISTHQYLLSFFPYARGSDATVLVGWDDMSLGHPHVL